VKFATGGHGDLWGVWDQGGYPNIYPVRSDDGGATWTEAGPQLATDWAGGGLYYVDHVIPVSPNAVVMVSNSIIDVTLDGGRHWFQSLNAADNWQMRACTAGENTICLRVGPASYARGLPKGSYALYVLETAHLRWLRFAQSLA
jgi:hypothetical protein